MNNKRPDTTPRTAPGTPSAAWLRVLDLGMPTVAPRRDEALAVNVFARLADCMP